MRKIAGIIFILLLSLSTLIRINFLSLYQKLGFYQGDIWYFYTYYGQNIKNNLFYKIEYPVGYILIQKIAYFLSINIFHQFSYQNFMLAHLLLIIPTAFFCYYFFLKIFQILNLKKYSYFYAFILSPSLALYSTINYDLFPQTLSLGAVYFLLTKKYSRSFLFLGLGSIIKIYPAFLLPLFVFYILSKGQALKNIVKYLIGFFVLLLGINLPFYLINKSFWFYPYLYQSQNPEKADPTTISYFLFHIFRLDFLRTPFLIMLLGIAAILTYKFYRLKKLNDKNFIFLSLLTTFSAVFGNQVYTPQYLLWFLPFLLLGNFIPLLVWYPFDLINASTRFFYFKLKNEGLGLFHLIWDISVVYYLIFYLLLLYSARRRLNEKAEY